MSAERKRQEELEADAATDSEGFVNPQRSGKEVEEFFGRDAIVAVDGGDIVSTAARWLQVSTAGHVLDPGPFGTLGTGAPLPSRLKSCSRTSWLVSSSEMAPLPSTASSTTRLCVSVFPPSGHRQRRGCGEHQNLPQDDVSGTGRRRRSRGAVYITMSSPRRWLRRAQ
jgi:hypothetical protein